MTVALKKRLHLSLRARDTARPGDPKPVTGVDKKKKKKKREMTMTFKTAPLYQSGRVGNLLQHLPFFQLV